MFDLFPLFDSHLHIIDPRFPLVANQGYIPAPFTCADYVQRMQAYRLAGGAIVSGSFQAFDQQYLLDAMARLGPTFVGVTQLPASVSDTEILRLNAAGVRALRFNLKRGGSEDVAHLTSMAARVFELAGWHVELYVEATDLPELAPTLSALPALSIDHLGLRKAGFRHLIRLAEQGVRIKATGFGRIDFDLRQALTDLYAANPEALMFGTDLPSTRAPRAYEDDDYRQVIEILGESAAQQVFSLNALAFYRFGP